jgi:hypothetical protein
VELAIVEFAQVPPLLAPTQNVENIFSETHDPLKRPSLLPRGSYREIGWMNVHE